MAIVVVRAFLAILALAVALTPAAHAEIVCQGLSPGFLNKCVDAAQRICNQEIPGFPDVCGPDEKHFVRPGRGCNSTFFSNGPSNRAGLAVLAGYSDSVTYWDPDAECVTGPGECANPDIVLIHELTHGGQRVRGLLDRRPSGPSGSACEKVKVAEHEAVRVQNAALARSPDGCCLRTHYRGCPVEDPYRDVSVWSVTDYGQTWIDVDYNSDNLCQYYETFDGNFSASARDVCPPHVAEGEQLVSNHQISGKAFAYASGSFHGASISNTGHSVTGAGRPVVFTLGEPTLLRFKNQGGGVGSSSFVRLLDSQTPRQIWEIGNGVSYLPSGQYSLYYRYNNCCDHDNAGDWEITPASYCPAAP